MNEQRLLEASHYIIMRKATEDWIMKKLFSLCVWATLIPGTLFMQPNLYAESMPSSAIADSGLFPDLTPEQEKELMQLMESDDFKKLVDDISVRMEAKDPADIERFVSGQMADDELESFLSDVLPEDMLENEEIFKKDAKPAEAPVKEPVKKEDVKKEEPKPVASTKEEQAIALINSLISRTESFITKCSSLPELPDKIKPWIKEDKINLPSSATWDSLKGELEKFVQKLRKALDKDAKTERQKYLSDLIANDALYKNLTKLEQEVVKNEPKIEITTFGLQKMNDVSKNSLFSTINAYGDAFNKLAIPEGLDKVFEKYEPVAKKIATQEKSAQEKAEEESKQKPRAERGVVTGSSSESGFGGGSYFDED